MLSMTKETIPVSNKNPDPYLKYRLYEDSVQDVDSEIEIINQRFFEITGKKPYLFREDFCGTGALACAWVKQSPRHQSWGVDLDPEPIEYGKRVHYQRLRGTQKNRVNYLQDDVLKVQTQPVDVVAALNFSYCIFKERKQLVQYFKRVRNSLSTKTDSSGRPSSIFLMDLLGGFENQSPSVNRQDFDQFTYLWKCERFNPITHDGFFSINYKMKDPKGKRKHLNQLFTYDWRVWSIPELKDILNEVGFKNVQVFWEEDDQEGGGTGTYQAASQAENCESWVSYIAAF